MSKINTSEIFKKRFIAAILMVFIYPLAVYAANPSDFTGKVITITDGDTIYVVRDDRNRYPLDSKCHKTGFVPVRMRCIDSPEKNQEYGPEAEDMLASLVLQETVPVVFKDIDHFGRVVGYVFLDGRNINLEMVESGYAWAYTQIHRQTVCLRTRQC